MASEDAILTQRLECSLCFELMTEPKQLSCSHTFCEKCLIRLYQFQRKKDTLSCPTCRQATKLQYGDVLKLQTNYPIKAMIGDVRTARKICTLCDPQAKSIAVSYCQACVDYMCESCLEAHARFRKTANHEVVSTDDIKTGKVKIKLFCTDYPQEEKLWVCTHCNTSICFRCRMLDHNDSNHKVEKVAEFQKRMKDRIESLQKNAEEKFKLYERHINLVKEQDAMVEVRTNEVIAVIDEAYEESIQQLTKRRNDLIGQCNEHKNKLKSQLGCIGDSSKNIMDSISSASGLISNGVKTILEGDALAVHSYLCSDLEEMLATDGPDNSEAMALKVKAEDLEFKRYSGKGELDLGRLDKKEGNFKGKLDLGHLVMKETVWKLEIVKQHHLTGDNVNDLHPTPDGRVVAGYRAGGIETFTVDGSQQMLLKHVAVEYVCQLSDGSYVVCDSLGNITLYTPMWMNSRVKFMGQFGWKVTGVCTDKYDNIYVGDRSAMVIRVFRPQGGASIRVIPSSGLEPWNIRHMHHSKQLVVKAWGTVKVIDDEHGIVKHIVAKDGYYATPVVRQDDSILIGWEKNSFLTIELYTAQLKLIRTVLSQFETYMHASTYYIQSLAEFTTGEIAYNNPKNLYIFRKV